MILFAWYWWILGAVILGLIGYLGIIGIALIAVTLASAWDADDGPPEEQ